MIHATASMSFTRRSEVPWGLCQNEASEEAIMRFGVALTSSFLFYDWVLLFIVEVIESAASTEMLLI